MFVEYELSSVDAGKIGLVVQDQEWRPITTATKPSAVDATRGRGTAQLTATIESLPKAVTRVGAIVSLLPLPAQPTRRMGTSIADSVTFKVR